MKLYARSFIAALVGACAFVLPVVALAAAPVVSTFSPADNATAVGLTGNLEITFDQAVFKSGALLATPSRIRLFKLVSGTGTLVENITASGSRVTVSSAVVTINPVADLAKNTDYFVHIEPKAFVNASQEYYAGISSNATWSFRTFGGGSAANKLLRSSLLADVPLHYSAEAPCLRDVGIFVPDETCGSTTGNVSSNAKPTTQTALQPAAPRTTLSQELIDQKAKRAEKLMNALSNKQVTHASAIGGPQYQTALQERTCTRVSNRFSGNQTMIDRVNERLKNRFGWTCDL